MSDRDDPRDKALATLYRASATEQPSAELDARILAAARTTAPARGAQSRAGAGRWRYSFALAATVLLSTTLVLMVHEHEADPSAVTDRAAPATVPAAPSAAIRDAAPAATTAEMPAPSGSAPIAKIAPLKSASEPGRVKTDSMQAPSVEAPALPPRTEARRAMQPLGATAGAHPAEKPGDAPGMAKDEAATTAFPRSPEHQLSKRGARNAVPTAARADSAERVEPTENSAHAAERSPEQWLADIRELRQQGRALEADASLAAFVKRHPNFVLPGDLKKP